MIEIRRLQKVLDQKTVIDIDALSVPAGEIAALVGPTGSGKNALFDLLIGKTRPSAGEVRLAGIDPYTQKGIFSRKAGVLFEQDGLYTRRSVYGNLLFQCRLHGLPKNRAGQVLAQVGLADHADVSTGKLSTSLSRRLAFGRAILHQPGVLLLFEPFARCDETSTSLLGSLMRQLAEQGKAILILANDSTNLLPVCDTIYTLNQGRIAGSFQPQSAQTADMPFKIPARLEGKVALVNPAEILFAFTEGGGTYLQIAGSRLPVQFTLSELETRLARSGFFRAHRSYLVNLQHVKEVIPFTRDSFSLKLDDEAGTMIPLSKSAAGELKELLGY